MPYFLYREKSAFEMLKGVIMAMEESV